MSEALDLSEIRAGLPGRIHQVADRHVAASPHRTALIENGASWSYRELDRAVVDVAAGLKSLGVRAGDRIIIASENCIALAALLLAASRIDAWAIVANPRLSGARIGPDPRSQRRAANVFYFRGFEGSGRSCAALWRGDMATRDSNGDRCRPIE